MVRTRRRPISGVQIILMLLALMLIVQLINELTAGSLRVWGIYPRTERGLLGILIAPFLHGSWWHLFNNMLGFSIFSGLCLTRGQRFFSRASLIILILGGSLVWAFGRPTNHIGASGWIFGLWSLSIALAWFERSFVNFCVALVVIVFYGGMAMGILPSNPSVSFEGHAFGAFAGVVAAAVLAKPKRKIRRR